MSDNIQENNMEGILSSIKNILEEDERNQQLENNENMSDTTNVLDDVIASENNIDVLELSPEMRVDDFNTVLQNDEVLPVDTTDTVVVETSAVDMVAVEPVAIEEAPAIYNDPVALDQTPINTEENPVAEPIVEPVAEPILEQTTEVEIPSNEPFFENTASEEQAISDEPFFETSGDVALDDLLNDTPENNQIPEVFAKEENNNDVSLDDLLSGGETPVVIEETTELPVDEPTIVDETPVVESALSEEQTISDEPFFETPGDVALDDLLNDTPENNQIPEVFAKEENNNDVSLDDLLSGGETPVAVEELTELPVDEPTIVDETPVVVEETISAIEEPAELPVEAPVVVEETVDINEETQVVFDETPTLVEETAVFDPVIELENVVDETPVVEEETSEVVETVEDTPAVEETEKEDVSANIMSNFAKMFSHEEAKEDPAVTSVGNSSKTLEELVVDAIRKAIGNEISAKWNNGNDFSNFAEAEIKRQAELWITSNMPNILENMVKKEVERLMTKSDL